MHSHKQVVVEEGLPWTLADVGQPALLNFGFLRLPSKSGEKSFHSLHTDPFYLSTTSLKTENSKYDRCT